MYDTNVKKDSTKFCVSPPVSKLVGVGLVGWELSRTGMTKCMIFFNSFPECALKEQNVTCTLYSPYIYKDVVDYSVHKIIKAEMSTRRRYPAKSRM
jgi:hypothetical protein